MKLKLIEKAHLADNVWAFRFKPSEPLAWMPGQYMRVELPHENPDKEGTKRWFTVSSPPFKGYVQITTRVTDSTFKQALHALPTGGELQLLEKPHGEFLWEDSRLPKIFVAGGIGITPYYSILKQRAHDGQLLNVTLIYGGRTAELPFKAELEELAGQHPEFKIKYVIGERLSAEKLAGLEPGLNQSLVYVSGPEPMVEALEDDLKKHGLPAGQFKQDAFPNYTEKNY